MRCTERAVAADAEQHVDIHPHQCFQHQIRILLPAGGTENRPALLVNAVHRQFIKDDRTITEIGIQSGIPVRYSIYDRHAINLFQGLGQSFDHVIQPGTDASGGQDRRLAPGGIKKDFFARSGLLESINLVVLLNSFSDTDDIVFIKNLGLIGHKRRGLI